MVCPWSVGPLRPLVLSEGVTVKELSEKLQLKSKDVIKRLMDRGLLATINQNLDQQVVVDFVKDFGYEAKIATFEEVEIMEEEHKEECQRCGQSVERKPWGVWICWDCYEELRPQTKVDARLNQTIDEHPQWQRGRHEGKSEYVKRMARKADLQGTGTVPDLRATVG